MYLMGMYFGSGWAFRCCFDQCTCRYYKALQYSVNLMDLRLK